MGFNDILKKLFGNKSQRDLREIQPYVDRILAEYAKIESLDNDELRRRVTDIREQIQESVAPEKARIAEIKDNIESVEYDERENMWEEVDKIEKTILDKYEKALDDALPQVFALVKATAKRFAENEKIEVTATQFDRDLAAKGHDFVHIEGDKAIYQNHWMAGGNEITWNMVHYDVQLFGGVVLHKGKIAEMATGEGKTLVATLPVFLNALTGNGVHVVTVNDYLAKRDSEWMGPLYMFHGLSVDCIDKHQPNSEDRRRAYNADITFGTNNEFGFDYLRDNMVTRASARVQRGHNFAIVDEVDSILIDEARTPLIISGAGVKAADTYKKFSQAMFGLVRDEDYELDEAKKTIFATETGLAKIEARLGIDDIYDDPSGQLANHLQQALKAHFMFHRDIDYVVVGGEVKIVDENTGRIMEGRRWSEGLHQAMEAKENVRIREENQTLATITLQNYFRLYDKLSGMTGTART